MNTVIFSFLWNKKPSKLKQTTVIKQYEDGGLKMMNIAAFVEAVKINMGQKTLNSGLQMADFHKAASPNRTINRLQYKILGESDLTATKSLLERRLAVNDKHQYKIGIYRSKHPKKSNIL